MRNIGLTNRPIPDTLPAGSGRLVEEVCERLAVSSGEFRQLDDVDATFTVLAFGHERGRLPQHAGNVPLGQTGMFPGLSELT